MAIFKCFNNLYISTTQEILRKINAWKKTRLNLAKLFNHVRFLRRAIKEEIIPVGFRRNIITPCRDNKALAMKFGRILLKEALDVQSKKLKQKMREEASLRAQLRCRLRQDEWELVDERISEVEKSVFIDTRSRQLDKFGRLLLDKEKDFKRLYERETIELEGKDRFVNLSKREFSEVERRILNRGLKFIPKDSRTNYLNVATEVELGLKKLKLKDDTLPGLIRDILDSKDKEQDNLSKEERVALDKLRKDSSIMIAKSDKGEVTVILDMEVYTDKLEDKIFGDEYELLEKDPTGKIDQAIRKIASRVKKEEGQNKSVYHRIVGHHYRNPGIFGLIKIHKRGLPLRTIISSYGTVTANAAHFVKGILDVLLKDLNDTHMVNNVVELKEELINLDLKNNNFILASMDVTNMFGSISPAIALDIIRDRVVKTNNFRNRFNIKEEDFLGLTELIVNNSFFEYEGGFFLQKEGIPMGSGTSPVIADLVMIDFEEKFRNFPRFDRMIYYKRYRDDYLVLWSGDGESLSKFLEEVNSLDNSIKFTLELEKEGRLPFLDALIERDENGLTFRSYCKPFASGIMLDYNSFHDVKVKNALIGGETERIFRISDNPEEDLAILEERLEENHYPRRIIKRNMESRLKKLKKGLVKEKRDTNYISIPFPGKKQAKKLKKLGKKFQVTFAFRKKNNLGNLFSRNYKRNTDLNAGLIYKLQCECGDTYVGETGAMLDKRLGQHKYSIKSRDMSNGPAVHSTECDMLIDWEKTETLGREGSWFKRKIKEGLFIQKLHPEINLLKGMPIVGSWNP